MFEIEKLLPHKLIEYLATGTVSSEAVTKACIDKLKESSALNALVQSRFDEALGEAGRRDNDTRVGKQKDSLNGLPITIKECFDLTGTPSTFGVLSRQNDLPVKDDIYVKALQDAGAIIIGKSNVSQLLSFIEANNPVYGQTVNPFNSTFSCGGSSGGEGALVGACISPLGIGTDIGGSVRIPAAVCGACSIKPTSQRIPDLTRFSDDYEKLPIKSTIGPMSQDALTLHLALEVLNDAAQKINGTQPLKDFREIDIATLNIGYFFDDGLFPISDPIREGIANTVEHLRARGANVFEYKLPNLDVAEMLFYQSMSVDNGKIVLGPLEGDAPVKQLKPLSFAAKLPPNARKMLSSIANFFGQHQQSKILRYFGQYYSDDLGVLNVAIEDYKEVVLDSSLNGGEEIGGSGKVDAIISPILPVPAYLHHSSELMGLAGAYSLVNNVTGFPAGVACVGVSNGIQKSGVFNRLDMAERQAFKCASLSFGLPLSVQISSLPYREDIVLALIDELHRPLKHRLKDLCSTQ